MAEKYVALPNGVSERDFDAAITEFRAALGDDGVFVEQDRLAAYGKIMLPVPDAEHAPSAAISPDLGRAGAGLRGHLQQIPCAGLADFDGEESRLRLGGARQSRPGGDGFAPHEPHSRYRCRSVHRVGRARRDLSAVVRHHPGTQIATVAVLPGTFGDRRAARQHGRPRRRLHALWRTFPVLLRHGGGAADRRGAAHRHGLAAEQQYLAGVQMGVWPLSRRHLHAIEFRHRHQARAVADAGTTRLQAVRHPLFR